MMLTIGLIGLLGVGYLFMKQQQPSAPTPLPQPGTPQPGPNQFRTVGTYAEWLDWMNTHSNGVLGAPAYPQEPPQPPPGSVSQKGPIIYYADKRGYSGGDQVYIRAPDVFPYPQGNATVPWPVKYPTSQQQMQAIAAVTYITEPMAWEVLEWWQRNAAAGRQPYEGESGKE